MKKHFKIACRGSWLSMAQAEIFKKKVLNKFPDVTVEFIIKETAGDKNQTTPLHLVEGADFFTKEIQDCIYNGEADFAVHSMKDVSSDQFFSKSKYAVIEREDLRDVVIFNATVLDKIKANIPIVIGTSSPRRAEMAIAFLKKALPKFENDTIEVKSEPIRGNVDTRLRKLNENEFDGIVLAVAGLNRLLDYLPAKETVSTYLLGKKIMLLPLFECPPAPGQGAIVAETSAENVDAISILDAFKDVELTRIISKERKEAKKLGYGCSQRFGVFSLQNKNVSFTYSSGVNAKEESFSNWIIDSPISMNTKNLFSSTDFMKDFFRSTPIEKLTLDENVKDVFISSHKAIHDAHLVKYLSNKKVWAAGTKSWIEIAKLGVWVHGCADGLGLAFLENYFTGHLYQISKEDMLILTNNISKLHWQSQDWNAVGTYEIDAMLSENLIAKVVAADVVFWTSYQQYCSCKKYLKWNVVHACPSGKTACMLQSEGIKPVIFPTIKSFIEWRKKNTTSINAD